MRRALLLLLAVSVLAGCGSDGGGVAAPKDLAARAVRATESAESYRVELKMRSNLGGEKLFAEGGGVASADQSRGRFELEMSFDGGPPQPVEMISADGVNYMRGKPFEGLLPAGKTWLKVVDETPTLTPSEFIAFVRESDGIEERGSEDVRGEPAVHLGGPLDFVKLAERTDSATAKRFAQMPQAAEIDATIDVWIAEDDDRIMRLVLHMEHPDTPGAMDVETDLLDYDVPLTGTDAPPAGEVADPSELAG